MPRLAKNNDKLTIDLRKDIFRWKVDAYPALIFAAYNGARKSKYGWPKSEIFFIGKDSYWFNNWSDITGNGKNIFSKFIKADRSDFKASYYWEYDQVFKEITKKLNEIEKIKLSEVSLSEFRKIWHDFFKVYSFRLWSTAIIPEVIAYTASIFLEEKIKAQKIKISPEDLSRLTVFPQQSFLMAEEYELLKIARNKSAKTRKILLAEHSRNYSWILNGYHGRKDLKVGFFTDRLRDLLKKGKLEDNLDNFRLYSKRVEKDFRRIVKQYKLSSEIANLAKLARQGAYLQDNRKKYQLIATEHIIKLYRAFAHRLRISLEDALYINWTEFDRFIAGHNILPEIRRRQKSFRFFIFSNEMKFSTDSVLYLFNLLNKKYSQTDSRELVGMVAYPGQIKGVVKIIENSRAIKDFPAGRILVTMMTSPDYIVAIKKAKAIITDDGGLTCHAAIVARELKKPCIVGTRNATQLLKDGDLVEVNADKGVVKIIKKK